MSTEQSLYCLKNIDVERSGCTILNTVSMTARAGEITVLAGPNGAGKSTALRVLAGSLSTEAGHVLLNSQPLEEFSSYALAQRRAVLAQHVSVSFDFEVYDIVCLGLASQKLENKREKDTRVMECLRQFQAETLIGRRYHTLSGGEQKRVQLARVLAQISEPLETYETRWLLLDEPGANLDMAHELALMETLQELTQKEGTGIIIALHDLALARIFADHFVLMKQGNIIAEGAPSSILTPQLLEKVYELPSAWRDWPLSRKAPLKANLS